MITPSAGQRQTRLLCFSTFRQDRRGSITIIAAFALPALIGASALAVEYGRALLVRTENQRTADLAAYAGALAYNATSSASAMTAAAANVAALNGVPSGQVTTLLVNSPNGGGKQAVSVTINTPVPIILAAVLGQGRSVPVSTQAFAEMSAGAPACVIALSGMGSGVTLSGGTALSVPACSVASNTAVTVPCGTSITTKAVSYFSTAAPSQPCAGIQPPSGTQSVKITRASTSDPLAGNSAVTAAYARVSTARAVAAPAAPSVPSGTSIDFAYNQSSTQAQAAAAGCVATFSGNTWTLLCSGKTTLNFGTITLGGGISVNFNTVGSSAVTYNFSGPVTNTGAALSFGPGTFNLAQGITTGGGTTTTFGAGSFNFGVNPSGCNGASNTSICHTGTTLTFGGPSRFRLAGGLNNNGGSTLSLGSGTANSYEIGPDASGDAIRLGGGSKTTLADATGSSSVFSLAGNLNVVSGGGSCLTLPAAAQHDIKGNLATAGGTILGAGVYTVGGYVALGMNGGGDVNCNGSTVGLNGTGVTLVVAGTSLPSSGTCAGQAFCIAAGYGHVTLTAPSSGNTAMLAVVGPASSNSAGASFAQGASTSLSGALYFPNGPLALSGGASVGNGAGQCLQIIASQISLSGGTTAASACIGSTGSSAGSVSLVQ